MYDLWHWRQLPASLRVQPGQFNFIITSLPCHPLPLPFSPSPSILLLIHAARQLFDGAALRTRKDLFLSPTIPIQSNSFRSAFHLAGGLFFFKILIFGHKCGGLAIVHGFGFPIPQQRHFHQDQAKLPRRFWPLALWPIGLCYGWAKARHQKKIYMPSRKSGSKNILMYDSSQEAKRYEN